jgi:uncharacterized protein (TIGR03118 family)
MKLSPGSIVARGTRAVRAFWSVTVLAALMGGLTPSLRAQFYLQTNLISDLPGIALTVDTNLVGAWGLTRSGTSPWWVNTTFSGLSLLFNGAGQVIPLVVAIPPTSPASATGIAFNGGPGFEVASNLPARFIFATREGTIAGWNGAQTNPALAVLKVNNAATASYTGLTLVETNGQTNLYAANFRGNKIDAFDSTYSPVTLPAGAFADTHVPANLSVFNIQLVGAWLYVTYAPTNVFSDGTGPGQGAVVVFDLNGQRLHRLESGYWMNAPWGVALAPNDFGIESNRLLVGMFGSGAIAAFDTTRHGRFHDFLRDTDALPLVIAKGLWGLGFGNGASAGPTNILYYASDFVFGDKSHGMVGAIAAAPPVPPTPPGHEPDRDDDRDHHHHGDDD